MSTPFRVDLDDLDALTCRISGLAGFVREELDTLDRMVENLHEGDWGGSTAQAHLDAHREWASAAGRFIEHVRRIEELTRRAHGAYVATSDANLRMLEGSK